MKKILLIIGLFLLTIEKIFYATENKVLIIGIPKGGTHLLQKCISLITNKDLTASSHRLNLSLQQLKQIDFKKYILHSHALFTELNVKFTELFNMKAFLITRDPRDQLISMLHWYYSFSASILDNLSKEKTLLLKEIKSKTFDENFFAIMDNFWDNFSVIWDVNYYGYNYVKNDANIKTINDFYKNYLAWKDKKYVYHTTFEKLVGPKGGGSLSDQINEVKNICSHLNIKVNQYEIKEIVEKLYGPMLATSDHSGSMSFREGQIGSWKKYFKDEHKEIFKKVAGQLLIDLGYEEDLNW